MTDILLLVAGGVLAGLLGGYLGLGGGIVIVPWMTFVVGVDLRAAIPASVAAIVVNSISSSAEYLKKDMVDLDLMIVLVVWMTAGNIIGSAVSGAVPSEIIQVLFAAVMLYTAVNFLRKTPVRTDDVEPDRLKGKKAIVYLIALGTGIIGAMIGVGGGVIIVPVLYLVLGLPLSVARGTSSFLIGPSTTAAVAVYALNGRLDPVILPPLLVGTIAGGKLGGYLGTLAKPQVVKLLFFAVMLYLAGRFALGPIKSWLSL